MASISHKKRLQYLQNYLGYLKQNPSKKIVKTQFLRHVEGLSSKDEKVKWYLDLSRIYLKDHPAESLKYIKLVLQIDKKNQLADKMMKLAHQHKKASQSKWSSSGYSRLNQVSATSSKIEGSHNFSSSLQRGGTSSITFQGKIKDSVVSKASSSGSKKSMIAEKSSEERFSETVVGNPMLNPERLKSLEKLSFGVQSQQPKDKEPQDREEASFDEDISPQISPPPVSDEKLPIPSLEDDNDYLAPDEMDGLEEADDAGDYEGDDEAGSAEPEIEEDETSGNGDEERAIEQQVKDALESTSYESLAHLLVESANSHSDKPWWMAAMMEMVPSKKLASISPVGDDESAKRTLVASSSTLLASYLDELIHSGKSHLALVILASLAEIEDVVPDQEIRKKMLLSYQEANSRLHRYAQPLTEEDLHKVCGDDAIAQWRSLLQTVALPKSDYAVVI